MVNPVFSAQQSSSSLQIDSNLYSYLEKYGWTEGERDIENILTSHTDLANFLYRAGLLFTIRGYQHTIDKSIGSVSTKRSEIQRGIILDADEDPSILVNGEWKKWKDLKEMVRYEESTKRIVSVDDSSEEWNYIFPNGLCKKPRFNEVYPIYQLAENELDILANHARKFYKEPLPEELQLDRKQWHYLQVFTSHNCLISKISHVGLRLIDNLGKVYSLGFEIDQKESPTWKQNLLGSYNASIASLDFDEFKPFVERRVTTIPIHKEQFERALNKIIDYSSQPLRFHCLHQNCSTYATSIMREAGHSVNIRTSLIGSLYHMSPGLKDIPYLGKPLHLINQVVRKTINWIIVNCIPYPIKITTQFFYKVITYPLYKIWSIFVNLIAYCLGATKGTIPKRITTNELNNKKELVYFHSILSNPRNIFLHSHLNNISLPAKLVNWQLNQKSTHIYQYDDSPSFTIVPRD